MITLTPIKIEENKLSDEQKKSEIITKLLLIFSNTRSSMQAHGETLEKYLNSLPQGFTKDEILGFIGDQLLLYYNEQSYLDVDRQEIEKIKSDADAQVVVIQTQADDKVKIEHDNAQTQIDSSKIAFQKMYDDKIIEIQTYAQDQINLAQANLKSAQDQINSMQNDIKLATENSTSAMFRLNTILEVLSNADLSFLDDEHKLIVTDAIKTKEEKFKDLLNQQIADAQAKLASLNANPPIKSDSIPSDVSVDAVPENVVELIPVDEPVK